MTRDELLLYLNYLLDTHSFEDYAPNGLQIEGKSTKLRQEGGCVSAGLASFRRRNCRFPYA